jgi:hypothetical protein
MPIATLLAAGCVTTTGDLVPVPPTTGGLAGPENAAEITVSGVQVIVAPAQIWGARPGSLPRWVKPIEITINNERGTPLRVDHESISLETEGETRAAIGPVTLARDPRLVEAAPGPTDFPAFPTWSGFSVPPDLYVDDWSSIELRYGVVSRALPEGELAPGEVSSGLVYFHELPTTENVIILRVDLYDAQTGEPIGTARVPLEQRIF